MVRNRAVKGAVLLTLTGQTALLFSQEIGVHPPQYRGVRTMVDGVFVTPVPGSPFSALVKLESAQSLADGTSEVQQSNATIARDSQGRVYNERRAFFPASFNGTPRVLGSHIFDPVTRLNTFLDPFTHLARQSTFRTQAEAHNNPLLKHEDLGTKVMEDLVVHGDLQTRTIPAAVTGTGNSIAVTDEYWFSEDLHMNLLTRHTDPRSGVQVVTITHIVRNEPDLALFQVPQGYKVVDENPPN